MAGIYLVDLGTARIPEFPDIIFATSKAVPLPLVLIVVGTALVIAIALNRKIAASQANLGR